VGRVDPIHRKDNFSRNEEKKKKKEEKKRHKRKKKKKGKKRGKKKKKKNTAALYGHKQRQAISSQTLFFWGYLSI